MEPCFSNATVMWNEREITKRESLIREIPILVLHTWRGLNKVVQLERCETPILTPRKYLKDHIKENFKLLEVGKRGFLCPETTAGTYEAFAKRFDPQKLKKNLPYCMWQVGCSFRDEVTTDTMRATKLRLVQFYQLEFQLFASHGSKAPYLETILKVLTEIYGGELKEVREDLPHYADKTIDWEIDGLEVASASIRNDWHQGMVFELAIGLDRLVALLTKNYGG